jgi:hypothetical protein
VNQRKLTPGYIFFYLLFWPETWRIVIGVIIAALLGPMVIPVDFATAGMVMLYLMLATIGYSVASVPARGISRLLKKAILGDRLPK